MAKDTFNSAIALALDHIEAMEEDLATAKVVQFAGDYDKSLSELLVHEGGYSNLASDPGGPTNFGITIFDYRKYIKASGTADDVRRMTVDQAKAIYRAKYWDLQHCDDLPPGVDYAIFDYGVNSGVARSGKVLRRILGMPSESYTVNPDVIREANRRDPAQLSGAICDERLRFLQGLRTWGTFGAGWSRRVREVRALCLRMAKARLSPAPLPPDTEPTKPKLPTTPQAKHMGLWGAIALFLAGLGGSIGPWGWVLLITALVVIWVAWWKRPKG